jgi:hypothetical protein
MSDAAILATLKQSDRTIMSHYMDLAAAEAELNRVIDELNDRNSRTPWVMLGHSAVVHRDWIAGLTLVRRSPDEASP